LGGAPYTWTGDPPGDANPLFSCASGVDVLCDNEFVKVNVPAGGATLVIDVNADTDGDDFDFCLYTPLNAQTCYGELLTGDDHVEIPVTEAGVYRVGVKANLALGTYSAAAALR
jgi:hypothetical protein